ncbi:MAG: hypothetical protein JNM93_08935 [Bacteriovoracaceae bacterium]|nr:hypothetical protein [Bacteriovoracaceae bacterium]
MLLTLKQSVLPVDDSALNINLPEVLNSFKPNAIISTGLGGHYTSEIRASDAGLEMVNGQQVHADNSPVTFETTNLSLWNAILNGSKK